MPRIPSGASYRSNQSDNYSDAGVGTKRLQSDTRQIAALLLLFSVSITFSFLADVITYSAGTTQRDSLTFVGAILMMIVGIWGTVVGYRAVIYDQGSRHCTWLLLIVIQLAWVPYLVGLGKTIIDAGATPSDNRFIPPAYGATYTDVRFIGAMGILSIMVYGFMSVGPMAFTAYALYAYQAGNPQDRPSLYYRKRAWWYDTFVIIGGFTQTALGSYIISSYTTGPLPGAPIITGVYVVMYPEASVTVGVLQILYGYIGLLRACTFSNGHKKRGHMQFLSVVIFVMMIVLQVLVQVGAAPGSTLAMWAPTLACTFVGYAFFPAYLDQKILSVPETIPGDYYGHLKVYNDDYCACLEWLCC